jgi:hypothetical protein
MTDDKDDSKPKEKTPKGYEIPVPKKTDVLRFLKKSAKPISKKD